MRRLNLLQTGCSGGPGSAPHTSPNQTFQLALSSVKLVAEQVQHLTVEPDVPVGCVQRQASSRTGCSTPHSRTDVRRPRQAVALTRAVPRAGCLPQPLRYHVEVGGTNVTPASYDFPGFPCSFSARWQRGTRSVGAPVLQGLICLSPVWLRTHIPGQGRSDYNMPCTASSLPVRLLVHLHV